MAHTPPNRTAIDVAKMLKTRYDKTLDVYDQAIAKAKELKAAKKPDLAKIFSVRNNATSCMLIVVYPARKGSLAVEASV